MMRPPPKILIAYCGKSTGTQTTLEYLCAFSTYLPGEVHYLHVTYGSQPTVDLNEYDVVINSYCARLCLRDHVSSAFAEALRLYRGLKIVAVQDEYDDTDILKRNILEIGFHVLLTCVPIDMIEYVYPRRDFCNVRIETVLTGYVADPSRLLGVEPRPLAERPVLIGYRGRDIGGRYGTLGFDKFEIGRRMKEICDARGLACDIRMDEEGRLYGGAWYAFIASCRAALGTESGSNVFDFDGSIKRRFVSLERALGRRPSYAEFAPDIAERERQIDMGQISPRIFEYAIMRTPMILYRGRYSGAILPFEHYIPLDHDFSNIDWILDQLNDLDALEAMADRAYQTLIASDCYSYRAFIERIRDIIDEELPRRNDRGNVECAVRADAALLSEEPTSAPMRPEDFKLRQTIVGCASEVRRMERHEAQTLEGFEAAVTVLADRAGPGRSQAIDDLARCLQTCRSALSELRSQRAATGALLRDAHPTRDDLEQAASLYESQMHGTYALYGQIDAAYAAAVRDEPDQSGVPPIAPPRMKGASGHIVRGLVRRLTRRFVRPVGTGPRPRSDRS